MKARIAERTDGGYGNRVLVLQAETDEEHDALVKVCDSIIGEKRILWKPYYDEQSILSFDIDF